MFSFTGVFSTLCEGRSFFGSRLQRKKARGLCCCSLVQHLLLRTPLLCQDSVVLLASPFPESFLVCVSVVCLFHLWVSPSCSCITHILVCSLPFGSERKQSFNLILGPVLCSKLATNQHSICSILPEAVGSLRYLILGALFPINQLFTFILL